MNALPSFSRLFSGLIAACMTSLVSCHGSPPLPISSNSNLPSDSVIVTTHVYANKGKELELDLFRYSEPVIGLQPVVIFVHGGGFYTGTRKEDNIEHFCDSLAQGGYVSVNMDYRLFLKGESFHCDQPIERKIQAFATAANDIRSATLWLIEHSDSLKIDPNAIFLAGSSSGAEAVLHTAYWSPSKHAERGSVLPKAFRYRGVMAFAGAIEDDQLITAENAIPTLLYHGTCDPLVPYDYDIHHYCPENTPGALPLHGSFAIYKRLRALEASVRLVTRCGGRHGSAVSPIEKDIADILRFLQMCMTESAFTEHEVRYVGLNNCTYGKWSHCE